MELLVAVSHYNQNYLGKVMLVLKRHEPDVTALSSDEQIEFWSALHVTKEILVARFQPNHFNYAFLMNQDRHVHLHSIPRYEVPREFAGVVFTDGQLGEHYQLTQNWVSSEMYEKLAATLREQMLLLSKHN